MSFSLKSKEVFNSEKYYKCITRIDGANTNADFKPNGTYQYRLHSFAKYDFTMKQVYLLFFNSHFKRGFVLSKSLNEALIYQNFSIYFKTFCRHVFLHSLLGQEEKQSQFVSLLLTDMISKSSKQETNAIKRLFAELNNQYKDLFLLTNKPRSWPETRHILRQIELNIENLLQKIQEDPKKILQEQHLPLGMDNKEKHQKQNLPLGMNQIKIIVLYTKKMFDRIRNIHLLRKNKKKHMLELLYQQYVNTFSINIPSLKDPPKEPDIIYMVRNTNGKQPIIISLPLYLKNIGNLNFQINQTLAKDVIQLFNNFHRETKRPFPNLKTKNVYINQKTLKPMYEQVEIIFDGLGIADNTNTTELEIALSPTPIIAEYEKCHLEYIEEVKWILMKKYYQSKRKEGHEEEDLNRSHQLIVYGEKEFDEKITLESIHIWRLLCIIYFIFNHNSDNSNLSAKIFNDAYGKSLFNRQKYLKALSQTYEMIQKGDKKLYNLLNLEKNIEKKIFLKEQKSFHFNMGELCNYFQIQDDEDSILQNLKFESYCSQLYLRITIVREISNMMLLDKYFKKVSNAKKYLITYFAYSIEFLYQAAFKIWLEQKKSTSRKNFMIQCPSYKNIVFQTERERMMSQMQSISKKVGDYMKRSDEQQKYLMNNFEIIEVLKKIYENIEKINQKEANLNQREIMFRIQSQSPEFKRDYKIKMEEVKQLSKESFDICTKMLQKLCMTEFESKLNKLEELHKLEDISKEGKLNKQLGFVATHQLILLIRTYTRLRHNNWRIFDSFMRSYLIQKKNMSTKFSKKPSQMLSKEEIDQIAFNLSIIQKRILEYNVEELNFSQQSPFSFTKEKAK